MVRPPEIMASSWQLQYVSCRVAVGSCCARCTSYSGGDCRTVYCPNKGCTAHNQLSGFKPKAQKGHCSICCIQDSWQASMHASTPPPSAHACLHPWPVPFCSTLALSMASAFGCPSSSHTLPHPALLMPCLDVCCSLLQCTGVKYGKRTYLLRIVISHPPSFHPARSCSPCSALTSMLCGAVSCPLLSCSALMSSTASASMCCPLTTPSRASQATCLMSSSSHTSWRHTGPCARYGVRMPSQGC